MKTIIDPLTRITLVALFIAIASVAIAQTGFVTAAGQLRDAKTGDKIAHATITVPNTSIGTVSNAEGEFILKIGTSIKAEYFEVSHVSYSTKRFRISEAKGKDAILLLDLQPIQLKEISVVPQDARLIVDMAIEKIGKNYSQNAVMIKGFYRESVRQRRDYLSISEAVIDIYKSPYWGTQDDQVKIFKGRRGANVKKADTLMVQLQGGPNVSLLLDIVKHTDLSIALANRDNYQFEIGTMVNIDGKLNWVINFSPAVVVDEPLYYGKLYIEQERMAITRAEFSLDLRDENRAAELFIRKKPMGLRFTPTSTSYLVNYKEDNGTYYLNYVMIELKFRCDWKKRLFKNHYTVLSEVAITDRLEGPVSKFSSQELFRQSMVFEEKVQDFTDADFWGANNIIEPERSIENAIRKITKGVQK